MHWIDNDKNRKRNRISASAAKMMRHDSHMTKATAWPCRDTAWKENLFNRDSKFQIVQCRSCELLGQESHAIELPAAEDGW